MNNQEDLEHFRKKWVDELQNKTAVSEQPSTSRKRLLLAHALKENATKHDDDNDADGEKEESDSRSGHCHSDSERCVEDVVNKSHANSDVKENPRIPELHGNYGEGSSASDFTPMYFPFRVLSKILNNESWEEVQKVRKRNASGVASLVTSPKKANYFAERSAPSAEERNSIQSASGTGSDRLKRGERPSRQHTERFLDLFIADLNEINEIPFFDIAIPREVAIKIFWHLDVVDLCRCAQVSKCWQSLAQDELLWCRICHQLGFEQEKVTVECSNWKSRVRHHTILKRILEQNWKNRTGKLHNLHHVKGGALCAASSSKSSVVAGYTNCQTKLWNAYSGETCIFQPSSTALIIDENTEEGTIVNEVLHVATCSKVTAASYTHGFVDFWNNEEGTKPIYTVSQFGAGAVSALRLWEDNSTALAAVTCGSVLQVHEMVHHTGGLREHMEFDLSVMDAVWIQSRSRHPDHTPVLAVATQNAVSIASFFKKDLKCSTEWFEVHNIVDAPVTCLDARLNPGHVAVGFSVYSYPCELVKVNVYDVWAQKLMVTLSGHTSVVSCVNVADSPPHQMVSGSRDRKVRVYDIRVHHSAVMTLIGHSSSVRCVQMDDVKVASGDEGGFVCVWDQRMASKLWEMHDRHPVTYCHFEGQLLVAAHSPLVKQLQSKYECDSGLHQRHRGSLHVYDFLADQTTQGVPDICLSTYDEPQGYNYNIQLAVPYDQL